MAAPNERLATSLAVLRDLQKGGRRVFRSKELGRTDRERLLQNGFLKEVMKGWLISCGPGVRDSDRTPWYASFQEFCARYCNDRFGDEWHLSPEQSLLLHAENTVIPAQVIINSPRGMNNRINLPFKTSLYDLNQPQMPPAADLLTRDGLRLFNAAAALIRVPESFFRTYPIETQVVLGRFSNPSELLRRLLDGGHSIVAGRLAGALRQIGRIAAADEIVAAMRAAGYDVREIDPFAAARRDKKCSEGSLPSTNG